MYLEDQEKDTLLYTGELDVALDYSALFHGEVEISTINLTNAVANIAVNKDSIFNFDYIINAFVPPNDSSITTDTTSSGGLAIDIGTLQLTNIRFSYNSLPDGLNTSFAIGSLTVEVDQFDLENQVYVAEEINLKNTKAEVEITKLVESSDPDTSAINMIVGSKNLLIENVEFTFKDTPAELDLNTNIGYLKASAEPINLAEQQVNLKEIILNDSKVDFSMKSQPSAIENTTTASSEPTSIWKISLGDLQTNNLTFNYDDKAADQLPNQVDFAHLGIQLNNLNANDIYFNGIEDLGGSITELSAKEKSGFQISNTRIGFKMTGSSIQVNPFKISTNNSNINAPTTLQFKNLEAISENIGTLKINSRFNQNKLGIKDLNYFAPEVLDSLPIEGLSKQLFILNGEVKGQVNDLVFNKLTIRNQRATSIKVNGFVKGLPDVETLSFDLNQINLKTTAKDLQFILGDSLIPSNLNLPKNINLIASAKGNKNDLKTAIELNTTLGNLKANGFAENLTDSANASYSFSINMPYFELGTLLNDSVLGGLGFKGDIKGKGISPETIDANLDAEVLDFSYLGYEYSDLIIQGNYTNETFNGELHMNDSNLIFDFNGVAKFDSILPKFDFVFDLKAADLQHLGFYDEDLRVRGKIDIDIEGNNLNNINGGLDIRDVLIIKNQKQYAIDSLLFVSIIDTTKTDISIRSNLFDANLKGKINLTELPSTFQNHFNKYLGFTSDEINTTAQNFKFNLTLYDPDLLTDVILPDLSHFETGDINGEFDSEKNLFNFNLYFSSINYADVLIDSLYFISNSTEDEMFANLTVKKVAYDTLALENITFFNTLANDSLVTYFKIQDDSSQSQFQLAGGLTKFNKGYRFKFFENEQIIDFDQWKVDPKNEIVIDEKTTINNLIFSNKKQQIKLQSEAEYLNFSADNFELENIFNLIQKNNKQATEFGVFLKESTEKAKSDADSLAEDTLPALVSGVLNANAKIPQTTDGLLSGNAEIKKIAVNGIPVGTIKAEAKSGNEKTDLTASLTGNGNTIKMDGYFAENDMQFNLNLEKLKLKTLEAFSNGQLKNSKGYLTGGGKFSTTNEKTNINGDLNFKEISFRSTYLGQEYHFENERITFSGNKLVFERFTVLDSANNSFKIAGDVGVDNFTNPKFDLKINSKNFQFLNTTKESDNDLFYGAVYVSSEVSIKGTGEKPIVNANVKLNKGTDITFVVPNTEAASVNREGIVKFVDKDNGLPALLREDKTVDTIRTDFKGIELTAFLDIDESTKVTIVIDPVTGDRLLVKGGGKIRTNVDIAGNISMNGIYQIKEGDYELRLYNLVRRRFELVPGSKLIWNGDPLKAKMEIEGTYIAKAPPIDLLGSQVSNLSAEEQAQYKRKLPFEVILMIGGEIMKPEISFKLDLPDDEKGALGGIVLRKLTEINQNESELNKQVFSLIVLKRFINQDPFASGGGGSNAARQSVSQLLNQQLNSLTDKYVKGVQIELNVDSYEDYNSEGGTTGRTDLNVALSKQLFNDRVVVRVAGDFGVENQASNSNNNGIAGDVSVEYKVTEDGRYRLKFYRDNRYAGFIEGQLIETGVSLIFTREYELLKNLFKKPENKELENEE